MIGLEFKSSTYGYPVLACNIFEEPFLKCMFLKLLSGIWQLLWAYIWALCSADLCFCFVSDLFYFVTQPVHFDIEPRIICFAQDCFGYTWYLLLVFCVCAFMWILRIFLVLWRTSLELYGDYIVSVDCLEYCNPFHNIIVFSP